MPTCLKTLKNGMKIGNNDTRKLMKKFQKKEQPKPWLKNTFEEPLKITPT